MSGTSAGGQIPKDRVVTDGFNRKKKVEVTRKELREAKLEQQRILAEQRARDRQRDKLEKQLAKLRGAGGKVDEEPADKEVDDGAPDIDEEKAVKSAYQMLEDMRHVYRKCNGRKKLLDLMKDDKQFIFMVKELMKIEASLLGAQIRAKTDGNGKGGGNQTTFVILKGLEDEKVDKAKVIKVDNTIIDMQQIENALNPNFVPQVEGPSEEEKQGLEAPETW